MTTESTTRISSVSSADIYNLSAENYFEKLPAEIIGKISLELSPSDRGRLSLVSRWTLSLTTILESACRTEYREKMRRIFVVLTAGFKTDLQPMMHKIENIIDQMILKNFSEKKSECQTLFAYLLPPLCSEYLQRRDSGLDGLLSNYIYFVKTQSRDNLIKLIRKDPNLAHILREKFAKTQLAQRSVDSLLVQDINDLLAQDQIEEVEIYFALIQCTTIRGNFLGTVVSNFISRNDMKTVAKLLDSYRPSGESMFDITQAFVEHMKFGVIDQLQCSPSNKDALRYNVSLGLIDLNRFDESDDLAKKITNAEMKTQFASETFKSKWSFLLSLNNLDKISEISWLNPSTPEGDRILRSAAKIFTMRGQFAQVVGILKVMQVDERMIRSIIKYIPENRLEEAKSCAEAIKDPTLSNLFRTLFSKRLELVTLKYPAISF